MDVSELEEYKKESYIRQSRYCGVVLWDGRRYRVEKSDTPFSDNINIPIDIMQMANKVVDLETAKVLKNRYVNPVNFYDFKMAMEAYEWAILDIEKTI